MIGIVQCYHQSHLHWSSALIQLNAWNYTLVHCSCRPQTLPLLLALVPFKKFPMTWRIPNGSALCKMKFQACWALIPIFDFSSHTKNTCKNPAIRSKVRNDHVCGIHFSGSDPPFQIGPGLHVLIYFPCNHGAIVEEAPCLHMTQSVCCGLVERLLQINMVT